jgi:alkanesulfonate monooxygenase SsuD/methylene tetrahydromethanopterin reductase-like flavin-dependent oxidoreductase (luciferase family)
MAGVGGHNVMFSFLRTPEQYAQLYAAYLGAGGAGSVAANRPAYVGATETSAWEEAEPALRILWKRFVAEGKIPKDRPEPKKFDLENAPGQFLVGSAETVADYIRALRERVPFDTFNLEPRWAGLTPAQVQTTIRRVAEEVRPRLEQTTISRCQGQLRDPQATDRPGGSHVR